jgi:hypothetical protein
MKQYKDNSRDISISYIKEILDILGIIETSGHYYLKENNNEGYITSEKISDILLNIQNFESKEDWSRTIKTAKRIFNSTCKFSEIEGSKKGTYINVIQEKKSKNELTKDPGYQTFLILALAIFHLEGTANLDFLNQITNQKYPLALLLFFHHAISRKMIISFQYKSDRSEHTTDVQKYVPIKINFRDGHWLIIGWDMNENKWKQYLIHSLLDVKIYYNSIQENDPQYFKELPDFDIIAFYSNSFGIAVLDEIEPIEIIIQVPSNKEASVRKRRKEGKWENNGNYSHWIIRSNIPDEVMDYVFKWNGILKIISPQEVVNKFQERLKFFLNQ